MHSVSPIVVAHFHEEKMLESGGGPVERFEPSSNRTLGVTLVTLKPGCPRNDVIYARLTDERETV